ncbi:MAG: hypothetical protein US83_C0012G0010 [Candidatus Falkowbacteria bacterium GW2011_GWC2_38_22]|uniref:GCN5-related N-acetyltransferase n=1 Tax=Candidatus Falkowbacteria bacterium GW2011_GWE1_38_31 TaxID=1618638 RepID=A0A0G0M7Q6_9BACT|nr:MAG: hypothetical protein US73_C0010G0010 [Candidatus Falkowbacteria bacterium GW2011_GWF2_38_1205]KKQ60771.1 MAG: hypothetical protein US83_C0012G0010 [Candidatus Falkowbacteria bacterium GW2011_GWC2_38_22]KKQ62938.1 MAG: hypothetical protein US84_C0010G0010 [Candidatus Falkowbacteria bacterium GW2011_GWF1_38_22]KKQ64950.1 MAG: hypothetical protein US87_C0010G0010 [Candidatus Falkowbacteria bacterium GW2011_GWE2_38_254]KKQ69714.1 MAG: hypothetical protein US91_C0010G0010 [Candidatus Falkowb
MEIRIACQDDIKKYTDLLQKTYQETYTDDSIGLTADCFSEEIFKNENT